MPLEGGAFSYSVNKPKKGIQLLEANIIIKEMEALAHGGKDSVAKVPSYLLLAWAKEVRMLKGLISLYAKRK